MSFGSNKKGDSSFKKGQQALTPYNFNLPDGSVSVTPGRKGRGGTVNYNAFQSDDQKAMEGLTDEKMLQLIQGLPTNWSADDLYNNPFYGSTYQMGERELNTQRDRQLAELNNELAARNQIGGSYDALRRRNFDDQFARGFADLGDRSRLSSADAYMQAMNMRLAGLGGLDASRTNAMNRKYMPLQYAMQYQNTLSPLQQASANLFAQQGMMNYNRPSLLQQGLNMYGQYMNTNAQAMGAAMGMGG